MFDRLCNRPPNGARVLEQLKAHAVAGDLEQFKSSLRQWDAVNPNKMSWAESDDMVEFALGCHDDVPDFKAVVLHRVLAAAAGAGQVDITKHLMEQRGCIAYPTALRDAFEHKQWAVLELFLEKGWDINSAVEDNNTFPILKEVLESEEKVVWCLEHGADPIGRTAAKDISVADVAAQCASLSVVKLLRQYGADFTKTDALHYAAMGSEPGRLEVMEYLIREAGFPIDQLELEYLPSVYKSYAPNGLGTALHSAVKRKCEETLKFLLDRGADLDKADTTDLKPIDIARQEKFEAGILLLDKN
ncbi:uncharacterized protein PG998_011771 [Apiospora kogelbergensis]|uniref:uncharacterized protein n=1 Tax=Apiospora kogelbergensis TaxID=1337665 RepID=UPI00312D19ED